MADPPKPPEGAATAKPTAKPASEGNPAFRMMGLPRLRAKLPSRNWSIFLAITGSFTAAVLYDRHHRKLAQQKWCNAVSHLSQELMSPDQMPRKLTVFISAPPGDGMRPSRDYFDTYVKPVLVSAAVDWDMVEGRREGEVRAKLADIIRKERKDKGEKTKAVSEEEEDDAENYIKMLQEKQNLQKDPRGGHIVIGRHTWKEYLRGLHEGYLGPMDDPNAPEPKPEPKPEPEPAPNQGAPAKDDDKPEKVVDALSDHLGESETKEEDPKSDEKKAEEEKKQKEEEQKKKAKPSHSPPYLSPELYGTSILTPSAPDPLEPTTVLHLNHLLGFFNTPIRTWRFLHRRDLADDAGAQVAALLLSDNNRTYNEAPNHGASEPLDSQAPTSSTPDQPLTQDQPVTSSSEWEQATLLSKDERDWHKTAFADPKPPKKKKGEEEKEDADTPKPLPDRPWREPVTVDPRIGARMRTALPPPASPYFAAYFARHPRSPLKGDADGAAANDSAGTGTSSAELSFSAADPAADPGAASGPDDGSAVRGNSRLWKGAAARPERKSWGVWLREAFDLEVEDPDRCRGWEHGLVGSEDE